jgi:hypothetical protein
VQRLQQGVLEQTCSHDLPTRLRPFQRNAFHCSVMNHQLQALSLHPCQLNASHTPNNVSHGVQQDDRTQGEDLQTLAQIHEFAPVKD